MTQENPVPPADAPIGVTAPAQLGEVETNAEAKTWGMVAHISSLAGLVIPGGFFVGPLVVWLMKKNEMPFVDDQGKESLNFQLTALIALVVSGLLCLVLIGFLLLPIVGIADLVFTIIAAMKANEGIRYRYPVSIRFIK